MGSEGRGTNFKTDQDNAFIISDDCSISEKNYKNLHMILQKL